MQRSHSTLAAGGAALFSKSHVGHSTIAFGTFNAVITSPIKTPNKPGIISMIDMQKIIPITKTANQIIIPAERAMLARLIDGFSTSITSILFASIPITPSGIFLYYNKYYDKIKYFT